MKDFTDNNDFRFSQQSKNFVSSLNFAPGTPFVDYKSSPTFSMPSRTLLEKNTKVWYSSTKSSAMWSSKGGEFKIPASLTQLLYFPGLPPFPWYPGLIPRGTNTSQQSGWSCEHQESRTPKATAMCSSLQMRCVCEMIVRLLLPLCPVICAFCLGIFPHIPRRPSLLQVLLCLSKTRQWKR